MSIIVTDKLSAMEKIGEDLLKQKDAIYTPQMIKTLEETVSSYMPGAGEKEKHQALLRAIYDYWVYGNSCDEEFYYDFPHKSHEEKMKYMTFRLREKYCGYLNRDGDSNLFVNKFNTYQRFQKYYLRDVIQIQSESDYDTFLKFIKKHPSFVVKPQDMAFGIGVYLVKETDYSNPRELFDSIRRSGRKNRECVVWAKSDAIVLEELIEQDPAIARIHPYSVNGVRVTTVKTANGVTIYHPWFKVGANHQFVTSAVFGTMDAGIDPQTGIVITNGYKENGESLEYHPDTGIRIPGFVIPCWNELIHLAKEVAASLDNINYVGWDFVLTPDGWCIMEGNYDGDFMWQMFFERGMREEFEELIGWKYEKEFWWES